MKSMMIVDDEKMMLVAMRRLIDWSAYGYDVIHEAQNGQDALTVLRNECIDLLFVDVRMPGMSGIELLKCMSEEGIDYPSTYIITSYEDFDSVRTAFRYGAKDFIIKNEINKALLTSIAENEAPTAEATSSNRKIQLALQYVERHINEKISMQSVADSVQLSPAHFSKLFSKEMHTSFTKYVTQRRIEYACRLLLMTNDYVYNVAANTGFTNFIYFNKVFKGVMGCTPNEYRVKHVSEMLSPEKE